MDRRVNTVFIACGALAHEVSAVVRAAGWGDVIVSCLPAELHNRPAEIPDAMRERIRAWRGKADTMVALFADCGTGGRLDKVLAEEGVERIEGPHCYAFYAGQDAFAAMMDDQPGTFFLTDFMVRHFDRIIWRGLGLDTRPELKPVYFGNYTRLVHLAQTDDPDLDDKARRAARDLGLPFERRATGLGELQDFMQRTARTVGA